MDRDLKIEELTKIQEELLTKSKEYFYANSSTDPKWYDSPEHSIIKKDFLKVHFELEKLKKAKRLEEKYLEQANKKI